MYHIYIRLKVISYNIFNNFVHEVKFHGVEFSTCDFLMSVCKKKIFGALWIFNFQGHLPCSVDVGKWTLLKEASTEEWTSLELCVTYVKPVNFNREL